jgi:hypothetical protein
MMGALRHPALIHLCVTAGSIWRCFTQAQACAATPGACTVVIGVVCALRPEKVSRNLLEAQPGAPPSPSHRKCAPLIGNCLGDAMN